MLVFFLIGKILIIGGSIANFTNVAATFKVCDYLGVLAAPNHSVQVTLCQFWLCISRSA